MFLQESLTPEALRLAPLWAWAVAGGGLGAIAGSYLATLRLRWPEGKAARGRSRCDGCGVVLRAAELVPILSWAVLRGRCARCGAVIDRRQPLTEISAALIGAASLAAAPGAAGLAGAVFGWLLLLLALLDLDHLWLPDRLTGTLALAGLAGGALGLDPPLESRLLGGAIGFVGLWAIAAAYRRLRSREGMGGGDPKLLGAIGLWLGLPALPFLLLAACAIGFTWAGVRALHGQGSALVPFGAMLAAAAWPFWLFGAIR